MCWKYACDIDESDSKGGLSVARPMSARDGRLASAGGL
jgi:hypothetical protein